MTAERYQKETNKKNSAFGSIIAVSFVLALATGLGGARMLWRARSGAFGEESQARDVKVQEPQPGLESVEDVNVEEAKGASKTSCPEEVKVHIADNLEDLEEQHEPEYLEKVEV